MARPLWQLLIDFKESKKGGELSCDECFTVLEYYAEQLASGTDPDTLRISIQQHLARCPNCPSKFADWIHQLEKFGF